MINHPRDKWQYFSMSFGAKARFGCNFLSICFTIDVFDVSLRNKLPFMENNKSQQFAIDLSERLFSA